MAKPKTLSAADAARSYLAEVESESAKYDAETATLQEELAAINEAQALGSLSVDIERKAELEELIPRREVRGAEIRGPILSAARSEVAAQEIADMASAHGSGLADRLAAAREAFDEGVVLVAAGLEKASTAYTEYDDAVSNVYSEALTAGLTAGKADPLARVLIPSAGTIRVDGVEYQQKDVRGVLSLLCTEAIDQGAPSALETEEIEEV